jgi:ELWxxDGT repeat protein
MPLSRRKGAGCTERARVRLRLEGLEDRVLPALASPTLATTPGGTVVLGTSAKLTDSAMLAGGNNPTGTITFTLFAPNSATAADTETVPVNGNGPYSTPKGFLPTVAGTYEWATGYSGDPGNNPVAAAPPTPTGIKVFNTGVDATGAVLADGSVDPHYQLIVSPDHANPGPNAFVALSSGYPFGLWIPDTTTSKWIAPATNQQPYQVVGEFDYQTTFDLTGFDSSTAQLTGRFTGDNEMLDILINGHSTGISNNNGGEWGGWTPFTISSGFQSGANTLVFRIHNDGSSTGLRVEVTGSAKSLGAEFEKVTADTATNISASDSAPVFGETVTYTAAVSAVSPGTGAPADGTVTFKFDNGAGISANVSGGRATVTENWPTSGAGHTVDATFNGDDAAGIFNGSAASQLTLTVNPDATTATLSQALTNLPNPGGTHTFLHETATFTATVHSAHGATPTGTISFFDHGQLLQAGVAFSTIGNGLAIATFTSSGLSAGAHTISAVYTDSTGDGAFTGSTSSNVIHVVDFHPLPLATNLSPAGSFQAPFVAVNGTVFFAANDGTHGQELWETTGTGTQLVSDINPGPGSSYPTNLTNVNGTLFFSATDGVNGAELWMSNGTAAGTTMVKDINPGSASSSPASLTNVNGVLFFSANDGTSGVELWRSNGTSAGTVLVKDIDPGSNGSYPSQLINVNGTLFFVANDGSHGVELFESNGPSAMIVKDIRPGSAGSYPTQLANVNGTLFFSATNGVSGQELWKSNGTAAGTVLVKDINAGSAGSYPIQLTNVNGTLFFVANDGRHGAELFDSNGTGAGTFLVKDINPGSGGSYPSQLTNVSGTLFFSATNGVSGVELWRSNGTLAGTVLVQDIRPGASGSNPTQLTNVNGTLFFVADDGVHGSELFESNGSGIGAGTLLVADINPGSAGSSPANLTNINGTLFFTANDGKHGREPWELVP